MRQRMIVVAIVGHQRAAGAVFAGCPAGAAGWATEGWVPGAAGCAPAGGTAGEAVSGVADTTVAVGFAGAACAGSEGTVVGIARPCGGGAMFGGAGALTCSGAVADALAPELL
jgi:hypothetical protein